jgi:hypothetical protein
MKKDWYKMLKTLDGKEVFMVTEGNDIISGKVLYDAKWLVNHIEIIQSNKCEVGVSRILLKENKTYYIYKDSTVHFIKIFETEIVIVNLDEEEQKGEKKIRELQNRKEII